MAKTKQMKMTPAGEPEIVIRRRTVLEGLGAAAKRLGLSRAHLSHVVRGQRESARTWARMREHNIRVEI